MLQDIFAFIVQNQLWVAGLIGTLFTTWMVRQDWLPTDKARVITYAIAVFGLIALIRLLGGVPSPELLAALPEAIGAILTAFGIALPVAAGGAVAFRVAKTQPRSDD